MTIREAIQQAKEESNWSIVVHEPTTVRVDYTDSVNGRIHNIELDLYTDNPELELEQLWAELCKELNALTTGVCSVEAYGYILE